MLTINEELLVLTNIVNKAFNFYGPIENYLEVELDTTNILELEEDIVDTRGVVTGEILTEYMSTFDADETFIQSLNVTETLWLTIQLGFIDSSMMVLLLPENINADPIPVDELLAD